MAFPNTLTAPTLATDERWSYPFVGSTDVEGEDASAMGLGVVGANPFRGATSLSLRTPGVAELAAFDTTGRRVATIHEDALPAGEYVVRWASACFV